MMKFTFCIAPLLLLQFINPTSALPWDPPTCPLPAPPFPSAQRVLPSDTDGNSTVKKKTYPAATKILNLLVPRQTTSACLRVMCDSEYYCCNDQTCSYFSTATKWGCLWATQTVTTTSTFRSTWTSTSTTTRIITTTTSDTSTIWTSVSSIDVWTTTVAEFITATVTRSKTSSITLTRRGMPTPTRCVHRPEEEEGRWRELVRRADPTYFITIIVTVTATPPATYYLTTTRLSTYWITRYSTRTRTSFIGVARTSTITSTYKITTTTTYTTIKTTTVSQGGLSAGAKVGAGVGGGVGGLAVIVIVVALIWKKCTKPTAADVWAGNQPVEDGRGYAGLGKAPIGAGGMVLAAGATDKSYQGAYRAGYYGQNEDTVSAGTSSSPPPLQPPVAYFQPYQQSGHHLEGYQELEPNLIHTIPRRPVPGSPAPPSYQGSTQTGSGLQAWEEGRSEGVMRL